MSVEQDHADAILTLLRADTSLTTYPLPDPGPKIVPDGATPPYVVCYVNARRTTGDLMAAPSSRVIVTVTCHSVGADPIAARAVAARVAAALLDVKPTIAGRRCFPIRHDVGGSPSVDTSTGVQLVTQIDVYRLESVPGV